MSGIMPISATPTGQSAKLRQQRIVPPETVRAVFDGFQELGESSLSEALGEAVRFCAAMASADHPAYWLTLLGPSGTGKTMLARMVTRFFRRYLDTLEDEHLSGENSHFLRRGGFKSWTAVMSDVLDGDYSGLRDLREDWFVCLDDIGAEYGRNRDLSVAKLYDVLGGRSERFTVITANLTLDDVNRTMDARIASRLLRNGSVVVDVTAPDYNLRGLAEGLEKP